MDQLLSCKELAEVLGRDISYVYAMRRRGFRMIAGRTTLDAALEWLESNPKPTSHAKARKSTNIHE